MTLTNRERDGLETLFRRFDRRGVTYVVARRYDHLPDAVMGSDIDLFFEADAFDDGVDVCREAGFEHDSSSNVSHVVGLAEQALRNPVRAVSILLRSPAGVVRTVRGNAEHRQNYRERVLRYEGDTESVMLHVANHLAHVSPYLDMKYDDVAGQIRIRVDPSVERKLFERRRSYNGFYVPSLPDELAHIVLHCVFDKRGTFSPYYTERCNELFDEVRADERSREAFVELLETSFYEAADLVYDLVERGEYDAIRSALLRFDGY